MSKVLVISDLQLPFQHPDALKFLTELKKKYNPDRVVCIGDFFDQHALSDYDSDPDGFSAGHELEAAKKAAKDFYKLFPKVDILESNHDVRIYKKAVKSGIPKSYLKDYHEWMELPKGWKMHARVDIDDVAYVHGHQIKSSASITNTALRSFLKSVVFGHWHTKFEVSTYSTHEKLLHGMCVGSLIDAKAYAFRYQRLEAARPIIGTGVVTNGTPKLVPMLLDKAGRWDHKVRL